MLIPDYPPTHQPPKRKPNLLVGSAVRFAGIGCGMLWSWARGEMQKDSCRSIVLGAIAVVSLATAFETEKANHEKRIALGTVAIISTIAGLRATHRWEEDANLTRTLKAVEIAELADALSDESEAKALQRRVELGLPNPQMELAALRSEMEAIAQSARSEMGRGATLLVSGTGSEIFPVEDLAQTIADSDEDESNFLFVGKSRSGKTSVIVNAMAKKAQRLKVDWFIFNGKPEKTNMWGGLIGTDSYWAVNSEERAKSMFVQFKACRSIVQRWQDNPMEQHNPMFIIADEVNNQRALLDDKKAKEFGKITSLYATQCMSEKSGLWISTHSHGVDAIGLDKKYQTSFQVIALGREGKYETLEAAIDDHLLIRSKTKRNELRAQFDAYKQAGGTDPLAFTDQGGTPRIVRLPFYSKDVEIKTSGSLPNVVAGRSEEVRAIALTDDDDDDDDEAIGIALMRPLIEEEEEEEIDYEDSDETTETEEIKEEQTKKNSVKVRTYNPELLPENGTEFLTYLVEKEERIFNTRTLYQNWGKRRYPDGVDSFKGFLARLISAGAIAANDSELAEFTLLISPHGGDAE